MVKLKKVPEGKHIWIKFNEKGIANRLDYGEWEEIHIHRKLLQYPNLYKKTLAHEFAHDSGKYTWNDVKVDFGNKDTRLPQDELKEFIKENPSSLWQFSPIWRYEGNWVIDWSALIATGVIFGTIGLLIFGVTRFF